MISLIAEDIRRAWSRSAAPIITSQVFLAETQSHTSSEAMSVVFEPIGFNWQISIALVPGLAAREVAVSSLGTVYALSAGPVLKGDPRKQTLRFSPEALRSVVIDERLRLLTTQDVIDAGAGGLATSDNAAADVLNPTTTCTSSLTHILDTGGCGGTYVELRVVYDKTLTAITSPTFQAFGRSSATDPWMRLPSLNDDVDLTATLFLPPGYDAKRDGPHLAFAVEARDELSKRGYCARDDDS